MTSLLAATKAKAVNEISADWWASRADGSVDASQGPPSFQAAARSRGMRLLVTVSNWNESAGGFDAAIPDAILSSPTLTATQVNDLANLCLSYGYDGIDLDWESLTADERQPFSQFVSELAAALHAEGKIPSVDVAAKTNDDGDWPTAAAEDYVAMGRVADEVKIMTYDYSGSWSAPGPISPLGWVDKVLRYAEGVIPPSKVWVGVPFYGCNWTGTKIGSPTSHVVWATAARLRQKYGVRVMRLSDGEPVFRYRAGGRTHVVVFQDRQALARRLAFLTQQHPEIAGICIWVMGGEDPRFWPEIASALGAAN